MAGGGVEIAAEQGGQVPCITVAKEQLLGSDGAGGVDIQIQPLFFPGLQGRGGIQAQLRAAEQESGQSLGSPAAANALFQQ